MVHPFVDGKCETKTKTVALSLLSSRLVGFADVRRRNFENCIETVEFFRHFGTGQTRLLSRRSTIVKAKTNADRAEPSRVEKNRTNGNRTQHSTQATRHDRKRRMTMSVYSKKSPGKCLEELVTDASASETQKVACVSIRGRVT